jgi:hypothetical protein
VGSGSVRGGAVIVSFEHEFVFLKVPKTAGTSVELFLDPIAGADAIVTRITPPEPGNHARNTAATPGVVSRTLWSARGDRAALGRIVSTLSRRDALFYNHMPASLVRERLGPRRWNRMYRFCFDRNPWDKSISRYFWRTRRLDPRQPFDEWAIVPGNLPNAHRIYTIDDELAVDTVGRYENLREELAAVLTKLGIDTPVELPRAKSAVRPAHDTTPIGERAEAAIRAAFGWEIEHFGWERPAHIPWS